MKVLSQRDEKWRYKKLGFSAKTIGGWGCTITALASVSNTDPIYVNAKLKEAGGYAQENLVIWDKVSEALPQLRNVSKVWESTVPNILCLVEVDFDGTPVTEDWHWVVGLPDGKMMDPWTGTVSNFSYTRVRSCVLFSTHDQNGGDVPMDLNDKIPQEIKDEFNLTAYGEFNNNEETWRTFIEKWKENVTLKNNCADDKEIMIKQYEEQLTVKNETIADLEEKLGSVNNYETQWQAAQHAIQKLEETNNSLSATVSSLRSAEVLMSKTINDLRKNKESLGGQIEVLEAKLIENELTFKQWLGWIVKRVKEVLNRGKEV